MKIAYASDLHIEFGYIELFNTQGADVLVLAGDICVAEDCWPIDDAMGSWGRSERIHNFFMQCCKEFPEVIYIAGNHEYYHGDYKYSLTKLQANLSYLPNLKILEKQTHKIKDTTFVCGTMWTDFNNGDPATLAHISYNMNDFIIVKNSYNKIPKNTMEGEVYVRGKFKPEFAWSEHLKFVEFLEQQCKTAEKVVVVTHHGPSYKSIHPEYANDRLMNGGYVSDLEDIMENNQNIAVWIHGHVHNLFDYTVHNTRVLTNPRGYINHEKIADTFELKYIDI